MLTQSVHSDWIVPAIPELKVIHRNEKWLCLNPEVPAWFRTTKSGALLMRLVDGQRSLHEYQDLLTAGGVEISLPQLTSFFQSAVDARFFEPPTYDSSSLPWQDRRLNALYVHLTNRCNLQCVYCYRESTPHLPILHGAQRFCEMLEYIQPFAGPNLLVTYSGGEPLMHPGFREIVTTSARLGYGNALLTNGTLVTEELAGFILEHFKFVKISLDGPNEETHSKTRGKGNFARVLRSIRTLAETGMLVKVQVTLTRSTLPRMEEIERALPAVPNVNLTFTPLLPMGRGAEMDDESVDNDAFYEFAKTRRSPTRYIPGRRTRSCHAGIGNLSVADTGDVYPCHHFHGQDFHFGNIFHDPFPEIFFGEKIKEYVQSMDVEHNNPLCSACDVRFLCAGGCHANTLHATGDHHGVDTFCSYIRNIIYDDLMAMTEPKNVPHAMPEDYSHPSPPPA
jgi:radical SAM protein with 4Fe4S-binding SPASM domain